MKKLVLVLVVLSILSSCSSPVDEPDVEPVNPFLGKWRYVNIDRIAEISDNNWITSGKTAAGGYYTFTGTYEYDNTYLYIRSTDPTVSHIVSKYRYEFKDDGNTMYLYWVPSGYNTTPSDSILQKIGD